MIQCKEKLISWTSSKLKYFPSKTSYKEDVKKKKESKPWKVRSAGEIFANHISNKELISRINTLKKTFEPQQ